MPSRLIVILDQLERNPPRYSYLLRADVPMARWSLYVDAAYRSPFVPISPDTDPDLVGLKNGSVVEKSDIIQLATGLTITQVQAELIARQVAFQAVINETTQYSRWGAFYNGSSWTVQGV